MKNRKLISVCSIFVFAGLFFSSCNSSNAFTPAIEKVDTTKSKKELLHLSQTISLPGVKGRMDHLAYDQSTQRIFICALGNGSVEVVDVKNNIVLHSIKNLNEPQGIAFDSVGKRIFVASGGDGMLRVYNSDSYVKTDSLKIGSDADNVRYDFTSKKIYIGYDGGMAIVNADGMKLISTIELDGHPESFQMNYTTKKMFVNVPDAYEVQEIDLKRNIAWEKWVLNDAHDNFPMTVDEKANHLFIVCRHPSKVLEMDGSSGRIITAMECSEDADDIFYDANTKQILVSCGQGFIDVYTGKNDSLFHREPRIDTRFQARTSLYSVSEKKYFLAVPAMVGKEAELRIYNLLYY